jgi:hypothetical protein
MRILMKGLFSAALLAAAAPAMAQEEGQEVIVTGSRIASNAFSNSAAQASMRPAPGLTLRRTADFAIQPVRIVGDTRDLAKRHEEIYAMLRRAIEAGGKFGVELATGDYIVEPLTLANYTNVMLVDDGGREDAEAASFLVKVKLAPGMNSKEALARITKFVAGVATVGRAEMETEGDLTLSVVSPDQYRSQIIDLIAADAAKSSAKFGARSGVQVSGIDRPVEWQRVGLTEVVLFLPVNYSVVPAQP